MTARSLNLVQLCQYLHHATSHNQFFSDVTEYGSFKRTHKRLTSIRGRNSRYGYGLLCHYYTAAEVKK